jgi:hypothetical protein
LITSHKLESLKWKKVSGIFEISQIFFTQKLKNKENFNDF